MTGGMAEELEKLLIKLLASASGLPHGPERQAALKEIGWYAARLEAIKLSHRPKGDMV